MPAKEVPERKRRVQQRAAPPVGTARDVFLRLIPANYANRVSQPLEEPHLPAASLAVRAAAQLTEPADHDYVTSMLAAWGQLLVSDLVATANGNQDCGEGPCDYVRSAPVRNRDSCGFEVREQMNLATSFLDGSALYGSSEKELRSLRLYDAGKIDPNMQYLASEKGRLSSHVRATHLKEKRHLCNLCDAKFFGKACLRKHMLMHSGEKKYQCGLCQKAYGRNCPQCPETFLHYYQRLKHISSIHGMKLKEFKCDLCAKVFIASGKLYAHVRATHLKEKRYACDVCNTKFFSTTLLKNHMLSHSGERKYQCACDKVFRSKNAKKEHYAYIHMKVKRHRCPQCPETFRNYFQRSKHISLIHGMKTKEFKCDLCPKVFTVSGKLRVHVRYAHLKLKRYACEVCEWKFYSSSELKQHMVTHSGERKYQCNVCKKSYARKYTLREHMRIHDNDRRFCNKESLKRHMVIHTGEKNYKCEVCGMAFLRRKNLKDHLRLHDIH
ncbi:Uncharacterized protein OBRU01_05948 [Operophtera brumata]|uniref:C2H2-type domain-containing protein n=1 Tax=Operophtera brumata TaxID=104452 RepID=A0A0L7LK39_OPEBR|nr:Uncharacterized protein OBRU01_05948 [Operophtera brumata]